MKATTHSAIRFCQRVLNIQDITKEHILKAKEFLQRDTNNIECFNRTKFILPSFPSFVIVQRDQMIVTIIPKRVFHEIKHH